MVTDKNMKIKPFCSFVQFNAFNLLNHKKHKSKLLLIAKIYIIKYVIIATILPQMHTSHIHIINYQLNETIFTSNMNSSANDVDNILKFCVKFKF